MRDYLAIVALWFLLLLAVACGRTPHADRPGDRACPGYSC